MLYVYAITSGHDQNSALWWSEVAARGTQGYPKLSKCNITSPTRSSC